MALGESPSLEQLIEGKCVALYREEVCEGVAGRIVSECDEVSVITTSSNSGWTANIGVYFITILLGLGTDLDLWYRLPPCTCIKTHLTVLFPQIWVKHQPGHKSGFHQLSGSLGCDVPHAPMQLHDTDYLHSVAPLALMCDSVKPVRCSHYVHNMITGA